MNLLIIPTWLIIVTTTYKIIYFALYGLHGLPAPSISIMEYKKTYDEINSKYDFEYPIDSLPDNDYNKLIDHNNFTFNILNLECEKSAPLFIVMVNSAPQHFAKRKIIRETWGNKKNNVIVLFALGAVQDKNLQNKLLSEEKEHNDFVQGSFADVYKNLSYKHVMLFKYLIYHCPNVKYLVKSDDDIFVNIPTIKNFLVGDISPEGARDFLFCPPNHARVVRSYRSECVKWKLSYNEYPYEYHPPSCLGIFQIYSQEIIFKLYKEAQKSRYFWIEDIYITGHLFKNLGLPKVNGGPFMIHREYLRDGPFRENDIIWPFVISGNDLSWVQIKYLWDYVSSREPPNSLI